MDCGLNMEKLRGSLTKWPGRRGTGGFQPLDRDLRVQDEGVRRSNLGRPSGIGRLGEFGRAGWRRCSTATSSAAALRRRTPITVFRGLIRLVFRSGTAYASCVNHWWHYLGPGWLGGMGAAAVAASLAGARRAGSKGWPTGSSF